jgi:hypothetical protein
MVCRSLGGWVRDPHSIRERMHDPDDVTRHLVSILEGIPGVHMHPDAQTRVSGASITLVLDQRSCATSQVFQLESRPQYKQVG